MKSLVLFLALSVTAREAHAETPPTDLGHHASTTEDHAAIAAVLDRYTQCVTASDEPGFRDAVFRSGEHFRQSFSHVRIEQDGPLAQASLDFVTRRGDGGSVGWKVLQLVKTADGWKIASELFTVRSLR